MLALIDFQGQLEDELNLKAGDIIKHVKKTAEEGWLEGENNGKRGLFPQIFVKEIPSFFLSNNGQQFPRSVRKVNASVQKKKQRWCRAEYSYCPGKPDELELVAGEVLEVLEEIEDGWWLGKKGELVGAFPSNFVQEISEPPLGPSSTQSLCNEYARVMFDYTPAMPDELPLKKGDVVSLISKETEDEGWWKGELNGKTGFFPDNFVILLPLNSQIKASKPPKRISTVKGSEPKESKAEPTSKVTHQPAKKPAPPPPVPAKSKPNASPASKFNFTSSSSNDVDDNTDNSTLDGLKVSSMKLAHPTVDRPKMQGKRPPKTKVISSEVRIYSFAEVNGHFPVALESIQIPFTFFNFMLLRLQLFFPIILHSIPHNDKVKTEFQIIL
uniref:SH3 domain-containing protein n=1 Tax=Pyxicephalus adspersus TaxID=30357 RepID=A0AAV3BB94_PYXAD|nr:TPA: hypothetical protein GDO54_001302 [Pyxicephalus adspersus]